MKIAVINNYNSPLSNTNIPELIRSIDPNICVDVFHYLELDNWDILLRYDGIILGGGTNLSKQHISPGGQRHKEYQFIQSAWEYPNDYPFILGICLGHQLLLYNHNLYKLRYPRNEVENGLDYNHSFIIPTSRVSTDKLIIYNTVDVHVVERYDPLVAILCWESISGKMLGIQGHPESPSTDPHVANECISYFISKL